LGYKYENNILSNHWNINLSESESILEIKTSFKNHEKHKLALYDDKKVILKLIDNTNFAVLSKI